MRGLFLATVLAVTGCCSVASPALDPPASQSRELYRVCWRDGAGVMPHYCNNPEPIRWGHWPLRVYNDTGSNLWTTGAAIELWNEWLGTTVFARTTSKDRADVLLYDGGVHPNWRGVTTYRQKESGESLAEVTIFTEAFWSSETMVHELGHVLGLDHDEWRRSIMYPYSNRRVVPVLEPVDRRVLKAWHNL